MVLRPRFCLRCRRGFTLVELLVVVSIIALLISILLPSLQKARDGAKTTKCAVNTRSIVQAGLTYAADDRQEFAIPISGGDYDFPESYRSPYGYGGRSGTGNNGDANVSFFSGANPQFQGTMHRPMNRVVYPQATFGPPPGIFPDWNLDAEVDVPIYQCPADRGFPGMHIQGWKNRKQDSSYKYFGTSYAANVYMVSTGGEGEPVDSNSPYLRSLSRIPNTGNTILYMENAARYAAYAENSDLDQSGCHWPYSYAKFKGKGWHKKDWKFNVGFSDGSARTIKLQGHGRVDYGDGKIPAGSECILLRGRDWQIDTMPGALLKTRKVRSGDISGHVQLDGSSPLFTVVN